MKKNKRGPFALALSLLLHIILLIGVGRLLAFDSSLPPALLEVELISAAQAEPDFSSASKILKPLLNSEVAAAAETKRPLLLPKKAAEQVSSENVNSFAADNNSDIISEPIQISGEDNSDSANFGGGKAQAMPRGPSKAPQLLHEVEPSYPETARRQNLEGEVVVRLEVRENGLVGKVTIEQSSGQNILDNAALAAVKRWKFIPAKDVNNIPILSLTKVSVVFKLNNPKA